jgi:hypothetical protein
MDGPELQISYLSNIADLHTGEITGRAWTISESLAVYVSKDDRQRFVEIELLDGAETLLPHFLPEQVGDAWNWMPIAGTQKVSYNRDRDILRLFNDKTPVASRYIAGNLTVGCDDKGRPICVELAGAAR